MSTGFRLALIWLLGGTIALLIALNWLPSVFYDGDVLPTGHDSFYHARRMLDVAADPWRIMQFDPRIHAPEGSWVPWPWGYDYLMGWIARIGSSINQNLSPLLVLVYVPAVWAFVTAGLVLAIAGALGLNLRLRLVAVLCFAFSPLTQNVHGLGRIDHHFFEYTFVLLALLAGLLWLRDAGSPRKAAACGLVLGSACAFHNGLFLLQIPLLGAAAVLWARGVHLPRRSTTWFAASIITAATLVAIPSAPFREGMFAYHLLSWFHVYIAVCTAACMLMFQRLEPGRTGLAVIALAAAAMLLPILLDLRSGLGFVGMEISELKAMPETRSVFGGTGAAAISWWKAWRGYSGLVLLLPVVVLASAWFAVRGPNPDRVYFHVFTVFGALMLLAQYRFHTFGSFALYLPLLLWFQQWLDATRREAWQWSLLAGVLLAAYIPVGTALDTPPVPGYSTDYVTTRSTYPTLAEACRARPGVVLADHNDGHYIRFHSECGVIANNLILTDQSREKIRLTRELFSLEPEALRTRAAWVDYVFVRRTDNVYDPDISEDEVRRLHPVLVTRLLLDAPPFPEGYRPLHQVSLTRRDGSEIVAARLFRITR